MIPKHPSDPSSDTTARRLAALSPAKRALLELRLAKREAAAPTPSIVRASREGAIPLSFGQQRLWFLDQLQPGLATYNKSNAVRLTGELDRAALQQSFDRIVRRHESLRTTFSQMSHGPVQIVQPVSNFELPVRDLSQLSDRERAVETRRLIEEEARRPFDLTCDRTLRALLLTCGDRDCVLVVTMHHIAMDAWSRSNLWKELAAFYGAFSTGQAPLLPELPIQYADFSVWQREWCWPRSDETTHVLAAPVGHSAAGPGITRRSTTAGNSERSRRPRTLRLSHLVESIFDAVWPQ